MDRNLTARDASRLGEVVIRYPAAHFGCGGGLILAVNGLLLAAPSALCLWLLVLCVRQLLFLAGRGPGDMVLIAGETSWVPVVGAGLAVLMFTLPLAWLVALIGAHWWRRVRRAAWLRLSIEGFEINDRVFGPRRYAWHEIDRFMLVAPRGQVGAPTHVGFRFVPHGGRRRSLRTRLLFHAGSVDGANADEPVMGYWDRPVAAAVDLLEEWRVRCRAA